MGSFSSTGSKLRTLFMGSKTWSTFTQDDVVWELSGTDYEVDPGTSELHIVRRIGGNSDFWGGGVVYATVVFYDDQYQAAPITLTSRDSNTYGTLRRVELASTSGVLYIAPGTTQTVTDLLDLDGDGNLITLRSSTPGSQFTLDAASVQAAWLDVSDSIATGVAAPFACAHDCVNAGNNSGWQF
jgi:hypothetical protein